MSSEARTQLVQAPDGRQLEVVSAGPEDGRCFLFHSGTPSAAGAYPPLVAALAERDLRLVTFSRPGYAGSSAMAGRAVSDVATDVQAILDSLRIGTFFCAGQSGGGPHALACAALLPDRVIATATLAGVAPWLADGLDWFAGMDLRISRSSAQASRVGNHWRHTSIEKQPGSTTCTPQAWPPRWGA